MAESDFQRKPLTYAVEALGIYFQNHPEVYVSGNLFIYYEEGNPEAVIAPDVFVVFGAPKHDRSTYMLWNEPKAPDFVLEITSRRTRSQDQGPKRGTYAFLGVREYMQYDPTGDYLRPALKGFRLVGDNYEPMPSTALPDGTLTLQSAVLGLELRLESGVLHFVEPTTGRRLLSHREAEQARQEAEQAHQEAEQAHQEAERARQEAERARQEAEQAHQEAERARQEAEVHARCEAAARTEVEARLALVEAQLRALQEATRTAGPPSPTEPPP
jgi:Uma2 family endonuclease